MTTRRRIHPFTSLVGLCLLLLALPMAGRANEAILDSDSPDTKRILGIFADIALVPRGSKDEARMADWLVAWAKARELPVRRDAHNNVLISVPAAKGYGNRPVLALQAHMDMVCQKEPGSDHDFTKDPIRLVRKGDWLQADGTTLGADDGIGMAIALFLASEPDLPRPALELLFTTDEEVDMSGAEGLAPDFLQATRLVNIDSETEGEVTLGSAGGVKMDISLPFQATSLPEGSIVLALQVGGLLGGHSGIDIDKGRANANAWIAHSLHDAMPLRIVSFNGGTADNAITREAEIVLAVGADDLEALKNLVKSTRAALRETYPDETDATVRLAPVDPAPVRALSHEDSHTLLGLLAAIPQGVVATSGIFPGLPETSNNIGVVRTTEDGVNIIAFQRSFDPEALEDLATRIETRVATAGGKAVRRSSFPAWPPRADSVLYRSALEVYETTFGTPMKTVVLHAGLECGIFAAKYPGLEMISVGPTLEHVHTPKERLHVPSLERMARFLRALLREL